MMKKLLVSALLGTMMMSGFVSANSDPVSLRKADFKKMKKAMGPMGKMVKGETAFDKAAFLKEAQALKAVSKAPWDHFPAGSTGGKSEATPEVWSKPAEFKAAQEKFITATDKLVLAAQSASDVNGVKAAFGAVGESCKACHKTFKKDH